MRHAPVRGGILGRMAMGRCARGWLVFMAWVACEASTGGCVNTYVVDPADGDTSGGAGGSTGTAGEPDEASGGDTLVATGSAGSGGADGSTGATGSSGDFGSTSGEDQGGTSGDPEGGGGDQEGGGETGPLEACQPCTADDECGGPSDLCVVLGEAPVCLDVCTEGARMCPPTLTCMVVTSVDGLDAQQCVPDSGSCSEG